MGRADHNDSCSCTTFDACGSCLRHGTKFADAKGHGSYPAQLFARTVG